MKSSPGLSSPSPGALRLSTITDTPETHTSLRSSAVLCRARRPAAEHHHRYGHRRSDRAVRRVPPGIRRYAPLHHRHGGPRGVTHGGCGHSRCSFPCPHKSLYIMHHVPPTQPLQQLCVHTCARSTACMWPSTASFWPAASAAASHCSASGQPAGGWVDCRVMV